MTNCVFVLTYLMFYCSRCLYDRRYSILSVLGELEFDEHLTAVSLLFYSSISKCYK